MNHRLCTAFVDRDRVDPWYLGCFNYTTSVVWIDGMMFPICDDCALLALADPDQLVFEAEDALPSYSTAQADTMSNLQPMQRHIDLDWCSYHCPCGHVIYSRHCSDRAIDRWLQDHRPHTNETVLEHTTSDGQRAWGGPVPDKIKPYPRSTAQDEVDIPVVVERS